MATGGSLGESSDQYQGGEMTSHCSNCFIKGLTVLAVKLCINCDEHFCNECLQSHNSFSFMKDHMLEDCVVKDQSQGRTLAITKTICPYHPGNATNMYCADEGIICCAVCISLNHRSCQNVHYILDLDKSIKETLYKLGSVKNNREQNLIDRQDHKKAMLESVDKVKLHLIRKVEEMALKSKENIESKYQENDIERDVSAAGDMMMKTETIRKSVKKLEEETSKDVVVTHMKTWLNYKPEVDQFLREIESHCMQHANPLKFLEDESLKENLDNRITLGEVVVDDSNYEYTAKFQGQYIINAPGDQQSCQIYSCCMLMNGHILITDQKNKRLKGLDKSYKLFDYIDLNAEPWAVCVTSPDEAAVTLRDAKKVQFVQIRYKMSLGNVFDVGSLCRGIAYRNNKLYIACEGGSGEKQGHIRVLDMLGTHLTTLETNSKGQKLVSFPTNMIFQTDSTKLCIADAFKGIITILNIENLKSQDHGHNELICCSGVGLNEENNIFTCGRDLSNIFMFNSQDGKCTKLLNAADSSHSKKFLKQPWKLLYIADNSNIILARYECNEIKVYKLERKL